MVESVECRVVLKWEVGSGKFIEFYNTLTLHLITIKLL